ncbi:hypothetical protein Efla_001680 [Eimeria flavescens]
MNGAFNGPVAESKTATSLLLLLFICVCRRCLKLANRGQGSTRWQMRRALKALFVLALLLLLQRAAAFRCAPSPSGVFLNKSAASSSSSLGRRAAAAALPAAAAVEMPLQRALAAASRAALSSSAVRSSPLPVCCLVPLPVGWGVGGRGGSFNNLGVYEHPKKDLLLAMSRKKTLKTMAPQQPRTVKTDPAEMPLTECHGATKVTCSVEPLSGLANYQGECVFFVARGQQLPAEAAEFDTQRGGLLAGALEEADSKCDAGSCVCVRVGGEGPRFLCAVGVGEHKSFDASAVGTAVAAALRERNKLKSAALFVPDLCKGCPCPEAPKVFLRKLQAVLETLLVELNPDNRFKGAGSKTVKSSNLEQLTIFAADTEGTTAVLEAARRVASGVHLARELVNAPANVCTTVTLAKAAEEIAAEGGLECKILEQAEAEALGMGCYLSVAKGSMYPPLFIHMTYKPSSGSVKKKLAFVGKGLCFDSGGYNIKRAETSIELMKFDMGGAAAVLGAAKAIAAAKPAGVEVHFISAAAENMVSARAYRPGDVLTASNGKTVEVGNTDAEGRLTLADALVYAERLKVDVIVDVATLTGACIVALGESYAGLFTPDDQLAEQILNCAERTCEKMWRMPFVARYRDNLESKCADLNNTATKGKGGGAITAAVFLKEFVEKVSERGAPSS